MPKGLIAFFHWKRRKRFYPCIVSVVFLSYIRAVLEKEAEFLRDANGVFMRLGIKSVTMDDIARELKMSKKTIYKYVKDKSELVQRSLGQYCTDEQSRTQELIKQHENPIDELIGITSHVADGLTDMHPSIHYDLMKYYPGAWKVFEDYKSHWVYDCIIANLNKGIKQGYYRDNINTTIIARYYTARLDIIFDPEVFPTKEFSFSEVHLEVMRYHIRGIASEKGMKYLAEKLKKEKLNF